MKNLRGAEYFPYPLYLYSFMFAVLLLEFYLDKTAALTFYGFGDQLLSFFDLLLTL